MDVTCFSSVKKLLHTIFKKEGKKGPGKKDILCLNEAYSQQNRNLEKNNYNYIRSQK